MSTEPPIGGVLAALVSPFDDRRKLDVPALDHMVDYLANRDIAGVALMSEAAEDALLSPEERRDIVKAVAKRLKDKKPYIVYVSDASSIAAADLARVAEAKGAAAVVISPPRLPGVGYRELYRHVDRIVRSITLPVLILARPGNALESLQPEEFDTLLDHQGIRGVVAPQADAAELGRWIKRFDARDGSVLSGCSLSNAKAAAQGCHGAVCALVQLAGEASSDLQKLIEDADDKAAAKLEARVAPLVAHLGPAGGGPPGDGLQRLATRIAKRSLKGPGLGLSYPPARLKAALKLQGHPIRPDVRPPYETLRQEDVDKLRAVLQRAGVMA